MSKGLGTVGIGRANWNFQSAGYISKKVCIVPIYSKVAVLIILTLTNP